MTFETDRFNKKKNIPIHRAAEILVVPLIVLVGGWLTERGGTENETISNAIYYLTVTLLLIAVMIPFFLRFEGRKPQAREVTLLAVLCALAVASRAAFAFLPHFKPMMAIIMLAGIGLGAETGFLAGAISVLASNFLFGQGPWTPWQMMAFGLGGYISGLVFPKLLPAKKWVMSTFGALLVLVLVGPLLDTATLFLGMTTLNGTSAGLIYLSGLPVNAVHAAATFLTLWLLGEPILERIYRMKQKYGLYDTLDQ